MTIKRKLLALMSIFLLSLIVACNVDDQGMEDMDEQMDEMTDQGGMDNSISSLDTSTPSNKYPHTKPILIQQAKYKFVKDDGAGNGGGANRQQNNMGSPQGFFKQMNRDWEGQFEQGDQTDQSQQNRWWATQNGNAGQDRQGAQQGAPQPEQGTQQGTQPNQTQEGAQPNQNQQNQEAPKNNTQPQQKQPEGNKPAEAEGVSEFEAKVIELTNIERKKNGVPALKADPSVSNVAQKKADDMYEKNYFSHTSPTYGSPFDMMRDFGVDYNTAGENIAQGQPTPEEVVDAWMNSAGHRKNILSRKFTHIGVGYNENGHQWAQMFIGK